MDDRPVAEDFECLRTSLPTEPERRPRGGSASRFGPWTMAPVFVVAAVFIAYGVVGLSRTYVSVGLLLGLVAVASIAGIAAGFVVDSVRTTRRKSLMRRHLKEPWVWDHAWDPTGATVSASARTRRELGSRRARWIAVFAIVIGSAIGYGLFRSMWVMLWQFGAFAAWHAWMAWRAHGVGDGRVSFAKFPFHPGERMTLYFGMSEGGASFERAEFILRHVKEFVGGPLGWQRGAVATFEIRRHRPPGLLPGPGQDVELVFDVPARARGTRLSARPPEYWVLDVVANTSAGPYTESFLVPIYEKPAPHVPARAS